MNEEVVAVFIPIVLFVVLGVVLIGFQVSGYRRRRDLVDALHRQNMAAIERGIEPKPIPQELLDPFRRNRNPRYLLTGMIWLFIGVGIFVFLGAVAGEDVRWIGLIPGGVGLAYLIYHLVEGRHEKNVEAAPAGLRVE